MRRAWLLGGPIATLAVALLLYRGRAPERCSPGAAASGIYCCGIGQAADCSGAADSCPSPLVMDAARQCVPPATRVELPSGNLTISTNDWEALSVPMPMATRLEGFGIDAFEVSRARFAQCSAAGACPAADTHPPGAPVTGVSFEQARAFCRWEGGDLPTLEQHAYAAAGSLGARYPWGATGAVCRRAAFGLVSGPCAHGATRPEIVGMRADGRSALGVYDLAGNVAEWVRGPADGPHLRGGSFRDTAANRLRTWSSLPSTPDGADDVGFRCVYAR